ncbi:protein kinase [Actinomadura sp. 6N118]|uniref:serine/threonine-protein kinase n=1 Tax=Actinomadura sp. 6N118 TaxID=3375151 RepID=UPI0037AA1FAD
MSERDRGVPAGVRPLGPKDPRKIGRYRLLGRLGAGGMGVVYLGRGSGGRLVAVKTLTPGQEDDTDARRRFRAEGLYAQRIASFCTARVIEDASDRDRPYLVTEYVAGPPLLEVVQRGGPMPQRSVEAMAIGVAAALVAIHQAGLVHRDLKPANVLLARMGPRVIDFGLASEMDVVGGPTKTGMVMGSPGWIAPERLAGGPATPASDVFGWGCLVAYAATGRHPFGGRDAAVLTERIMSMPPEPNGLPEPLGGLVSAALAKEPAVRPRAVDLLNTLLAARAAAGDDGMAAAAAIAELWDPPPEPDGVPGGEPRRLPRFRPALAAIGSTVAAVLLIAVVGATELGSGTKEPPSSDRLIVNGPSGGTAPSSPASGWSTAETAGAPSSTTPSANRTGPPDGRSPRVAPSASPGVPGTPTASPTPTESAEQLPPGQKKTPPGHTKKPKKKDRGEEETAPEPYAVQ